MNRSSIRFNAVVPKLILTMLLGGLAMMLLWGAWVNAIDRSWIASGLGVVASGAVLFGLMRLLTKFSRPFDCLPIYGLTLAICLVAALSEVSPKVRQMMGVLPAFALQILAPPLAAELDEAQQHIAKDHEHNPRTPVDSREQELEHDK